MRFFIRYLLYAVATYLTIALALHVYAHSSGPPRGVEVIDLGNTSFTVILRLVNGSTMVIDKEVSLDIDPSDILSIEIRYCSYSYRVIPIDVPYVVIYIPRCVEPSIDVVRCYSLYSYPWRDAPWGLEIMVGTEDSYVEESEAGITFLLHYYEALHHVKNIIDRYGWDERTRYEVAATALWCAQLVREVKEQIPDIAVNSRSVEVVLGPILGFLARPLILLLAYVAHAMPRDVLYASVLDAILYVERYVEIFPSWRDLDYSTWIELCRSFEGYTYLPRVASYAHTLLAGALAIHMVKMYWPILLAMTVSIIGIVGLKTLKKRIYP